MKLHEQNTASMIKPHIILHKTYCGWKGFFHCINDLLLSKLQVYNTWIMLSTHFWQFAQATTNLGTVSLQQITLCYSRVKLKKTITALKYKCSFWCQLHSCVDILVYYMCCYNITPLNDNVQSCRRNCCRR